MSSTRMLSTWTTSSHPCMEHSYGSWDQVADLKSSFDMTKVAWLTKSRYILVGYQLPILAEHEPRPSNMHKNLDQIPNVIFHIVSNMEIHQNPSDQSGDSWLHSMIPEDLADLPNRGCWCRQNDPLLPGSAVVSLSQEFMGISCVSSVYIYIPVYILHMSG